jgi:hypothetical protein
VDVIAFAEQIDKIPSRSAPRVENPLTGRDSAAQKLIEQVDVDLAELFA